MSCSLHSPPVHAVLKTLHATSEEVDPPLLAAAQGKDGDERAALLDQAFIPVSPDAGRPGSWALGIAPYKLDTWNRQ